MKKIKVYHTEDCNILLLQQQTVAIIGFGAQGAAHAANLKDAGVPIIVGLREAGNSWQKAQKEGFHVMPIGKAVAESSVVMLLIPDEIQADVYHKEIAPNLTKGATLAFAHGFNIHYGYIKPRADINVMMIAPKAQGKAVRSEYLYASGIPSLIAVGNDPSGKTKSLALAYALAIGSGKMGIMETSFKNETETDLFGEQAVLCGGMMELAKAGFDTLTEAGYPPEIAYFECVHELKLVVDLLYQGGYEYMQQTISNTAEYGAWASGDKIINDATKIKMREILHDIQTGAFAKAFMNEAKSDYPNLVSHRKKTALSLVEIAGNRIRSMRQNSPNNNKKQ